MTLDLEAASTLRHDLITPVNHILGYCEILIEDSDQKRRAFRSLSVRSVQALGRLALEVIDHAFESPTGPGPAADLAAMNRALVGPCSAIIEACKAIEEASGEPDHASPFHEDLAKIQDAAGNLIEMSGRLA